MSNFNSTAFNPETKQLEACTFLDDHFGSHRYGIRFGDTSQIYSEAQVEHAIKVYYEAENAKKTEERAVAGNDRFLYAAIAALQEDIHRENVKAGWWTDPVSGQDLRDREHIKTALGWKLLLAHSEISEAAEGLRKGLMDDKLPHRSMMEVEIADTIIRLLDLAGASNLDIAGALCEKRAYNAKREDHKPANRAKAGGKSF